MEFFPNLNIATPVGTVVELDELRCLKCKQFVFLHELGEAGWSCDYCDRTNFCFDHTSPLYGCHTVHGNACNNMMCEKCYRQKLFNRKCCNLVQCFAKYFQFHFNLLLTSIAGNHGEAENVDIYANIPIIGDLLRCGLLSANKAQDIVNVIRGILKSGDLDEFQHLQNQFIYDNINFNLLNIIPNEASFELTPIASLVSADNQRYLNIIREMCESRVFSVVEFCVNGIIELVDPVVSNCFPFFLQCSDLMTYWNYLVFQGIIEMFSFCNINLLNLSNGVPVNPPFTAFRAQAWSIDENYSNQNLTFFCLLNDMCLRNLISSPAILDWKLPDFNIYYNCNGDKLYCFGDQTHIVFCFAAKSSIPVTDKTALKFAVFNEKLVTVSPVLNESFKGFSFHDYLNSCLKESSKRLYFIGYDSSVGLACLAYLSAEEFLVKQMDTLATEDEIASRIEERLHCYGFAPSPFCDNHEYRHSSHNVRVVVSENDPIYRSVSNFSSYFVVPYGITGDRLALSQLEKPVSIVSLARVNLMQSFPLLMLLCCGSTEGNHSLLYYYQELRKQQELLPKSDSTLKNSGSFLSESELNLIINDDSLTINERQLLTASEEQFQKLLYSSTSESLAPSAGTNDQMKPTIPDANSDLVSVTNNLLENNREETIFDYINYNQYEKFKSALVSNPLCVQESFKDGDSVLYYIIINKRIEMLQFMFFSFGIIEDSNTAVIGSSEEIDINHINSDKRSALFFAVTSAYTPLVKVLLLHPLIDVNLGFGEVTPLVRAINNDYLEIFYMLIVHKNINVNGLVTVKSGDANLELNITCFSCLSKYALEYVKHLLEHASLDLSNCSYPLIQCATRADRVDVVQLLLSKGFNIHEEDSDGRDALMVACKGNNQEIVKLFLSERRAEINLNHSDKNGLSTLAYAVLSGDHALVQLLFDSGLPVEVNYTNNGKGSALKIAINSFPFNSKLHEVLMQHPDTSPDFDSVFELNYNVFRAVAPLIFGFLSLEAFDKIIFSQEFEVNKQTPDGYTLLHCLSVFQKKEYVQRLLAHPAILVNVCANSEKHTPLHCIMQVYELDALVKLLLKDEEKTCDIINLLLNRTDIDINSLDALGRSPVMLSRSKDVVEMFLDDSRFDYSQPYLLTYLVRLDDVSIIRRVLDKNPHLNINMLNGEGQNSLSNAILSKSFKVAKFLFSVPNIDVNTKDQDGDSPCHNLVVYGDIEYELLEMFFSNPSCDINSLIRIIDVSIVGFLLIKKDKKGLDLLIRHCWERVDLTRISVSASTIHSLKDHLKEEIDESIDETISGYTCQYPLQMVIDLGDLEILQKFLTHPTFTDVNVDVRNGFTMLAVAVMSHSEISIIKYLVDHPDIDFTKRYVVKISGMESSNNNILHLAIKFQLDCESVKVILQRGGISSLLEQANSWNVTPLSLACMLSGDSIDLVKLFVDFGCDVGFESGTKRNPLAICIIFKHYEVFKYLMSISGFDVSPIVYLHSAIDNKDIRFVRDLLLKNRYENDSYNTALQWLFLPILKSRPKGQNDEEEINLMSSGHPFIHACAVGQDEVVDLILDYMEIDDDVMGLACEVLAMRGNEKAFGRVIAKKLLNEAKEREIVDLFVSDSGKYTFLHFSIAKRFINEKQLKKASENLLECLTVLPTDFHLASLFVSVTLSVDASFVFDAISFDNCYLKAVVYYLNCDYSKSLEELQKYRTTSASVLANGVVVLFGLIEIKRKSFATALEWFQQVNLTVPTVITDYKLVLEYAFALILFSLRQWKSAYIRFSTVKLCNRFYYETDVYCAIILFQTNLKEKSLKVYEDSLIYFSWLPIHERNLLLHLGAKIKLEHYISRVRILGEDFEKRNSDLESQLQDIIIENPLLKMSAYFVLNYNVISFLPYCHLALQNVDGTWKPDFSNFLTCIKHPLELVDSELLVPVLSYYDSFQSLFKRRPVAKRRTSAKYLKEFSLSHDHMFFNQIWKLIYSCRERILQFEQFQKELQNTLAVINKEDRSTLTKEECKNLDDNIALKTQEKHFLSRVCNLLSGVDSYYCSFINTFCEEFGQGSQYSQDKNLDDYVMALVDLVTKTNAVKDFRFNLFQPIEDVYELCQAFIEPKALESCQNCVQTFLKGYDIADETQRTLYNELIFHPLDRRHLSLSNEEKKHGFHYVRKINEIFYKLMPYAPGIEFAVNSLNKLILDETSVPTRLIKLRGRSPNNWNNVAYYQASIAVGGLNFDDILSAEPKCIEKIEMKSFSALFLSSILVGTGDCKPDNLIGQIERDCASNEITSIRLIDIDKDISFCNGRLGFRKLSKTKGKLYSDFLNILFFFPQMDHPVETSIQMELLSSITKPEEIVSSWLKSLFNQNTVYQNLLKVGFKREDLEELKLPIMLPKRISTRFYEFPGTAEAIYIRLLKICNLLKEGKVISHSYLLRDFYPGISQYYETKRENMKRGEEAKVLKGLYMEACDDLKLKQELATKDRASSKMAWNTASTSKMLNKEKFKAKFNGTIEHIAMEFLESIDFSRFPLGEDRICQILMNNLSFLTELHLTNIVYNVSQRRDQLKMFFKKWFPAEDGGVGGGGGVGLDEDSLDIHGRVAVDVTNVPRPEDCLIKKVILYGIREETRNAIVISHTYKFLTETLNIAIVFVESRVLIETVPTNAELSSAFHFDGELETLKTALVELMSKAHELYNSAIDSIEITKRINIIIKMIKDPRIVTLSPLLDKSSSGDNEIPESILFQFHTMLLEYPTLLANIAIELAYKKAFMNNQAFIVDLLNHSEVNRFLAVITHTLCNSPSILARKDIYSHKYICDLIKESTLLTKEMKDVTLCKIINSYGSYIASHIMFTVDILSINSSVNTGSAGTSVGEATTDSSQIWTEFANRLQIVSSYEKDEELLIYLTGYGYTITDKEWKSKELDYFKFCCAKCLKTIFHRFASYKQRFFEEQHCSFVKEIKSKYLNRPTLLTNRSFENSIDCHFHIEIQNTLYKMLLASMKRRNYMREKKSPGQTQVGTGQGTGQGIIGQERGYTSLDGEGTEFDQTTSVNCKCEQVERCLWTVKDYENFLVYDIARSNYSLNVMNDLYEFFNGNAYVSLVYTKENEPNRFGEHRFTSPLSDLSRISKIFTIIHWSFTIKDAWMLHCPVGIKNKNDQNSKIESFLSNQCYHNGNSLLYCILLTSDEEFYQMNESKEEVLSFLINGKKVKSGINETKRWNDSD
jgi:ankyrin repeat protein